MKKHYLYPCMLIAALSVWSCSEETTEPGPASDGTPVATKASASNGQPGYYTVTWSADNGWVPTLSTIDTRTGLGTQVCVFQIDPDDGYPGAFYTPYGVAFDVDGTMYTTINWFDGVPEHSSSRLAKVDMVTGELTYIGDPYPINFAGPEMDQCGNIYSTGFTVGDPAYPEGPYYVWGDSNLYILDKHTGEMTLIGDTGHTEWMDLEFDSDGRLWSTFGNKLYIIDTETGASEFVTDIVGVPQEDVPGVCEEDWPYMEVMSLAFDKHGTLWATAIRGFSACDDVDTPVMWIDTQTGVATVVGYTHLGYNHAGDIMPTKVEVCHRRGNGSYRPISVSLSALPAHLAHGDILPQDGEDCQCP